MRTIFAFAVIFLTASSVFAQLQFKELANRRLPRINGGTHAMAFGDVNGDGHSDLICGYAPTPKNPTAQNQLYLNDGTGVFTDATAARMPIDFDATYAVTLGDVDGDGDSDLIFANNPGQNRLYLNDGSGTFSDATATQMPADGDFTYAVELGDVDGDGDSDLVFANEGQNRLYRNNGTGTFSDVTTTHMPVAMDISHSVALADVDSDGDSDLVFGNRKGRNRLYW